MRFLYFIMLTILLWSYWRVLNRAGETSSTLTALLGWLIGVGFFMIAPFTILTLNGGFKQPAIYRVNGTWDEVNLGSLLYLRPYIVIWLCLMLTVGTAFVLTLDRSAAKLYDHILSHGRLKRIVLGTMVLSIIDWAVMIWLQGGISELLLSNWYTRNNELAERAGFIYVVFTRLSLTNQMIFTGAAALHANFALKQRSARWGFTSLILLFFLIELVISGNRIFLALYLLAFLTSAWLCRRKKIIAALLLASPILALAFSLWAAVRSDLGKVSDSNAPSAYEADVGNQTITHLMGVTEGSGIMLLMHMINDFGTKFDYLYGGTYARPLTLVLPRRFCPVRPPDMTSLAAQLYEPGESTSLGSTSLGEAYANFGIAGILVLPALTWFAVWCDKRISRSGNHFLLSAVSFVMFIGFVRFPFAENSLTWIAALLVIWALKLERGLVLPAQFTGNAIPANTPLQPGSARPGVE